MSLDLCWVPSWANPSDAPSRFYSVSKWRTALPLLSEQLHVTSEAHPEAQVDVDRLLEPLSKGARASLQRLREKQGIPSNIVTESSEPAEETKFAVDNRNAPIPHQESSKDVTRERDTATLQRKPTISTSGFMWQKKTNACGSRTSCVTDTCSWLRC